MSNLPDFATMSAADLDRYMRMAREAKKAVKAAESLRVGNILSDAVETVLTEEEITETDGDRPWAGYRVTGALTLDGVDYNVSLIVTDTKRTQALRDAKKAPAGA